MSIDMFPDAAIDYIIANSTPKPKTIDDLIDVDHLTTHIAEGYVRSRSHPDDENLVILNYTEKAQYEKVWTPTTLQCRGLIVDYPSGRIVARPFDKFFNVGEYALEGGGYGRAIMEPDALVRAVDKLDGSLGILYTAPDGLPAIATRGSFASEQAIHATALLRERYGYFEGKSGQTPLFEIVYPENRIVLDYGDQDDLVLLGARNIETGRIWGPEVLQSGRREEVWVGPRAEVLPPTTFAEALAFGDRTNREGLVVTFESTGLMVKIKQEDYVRLHKLVTGLNERAVWEHLSTHHGEIGDLLEAIPDEFHDWVDKVADDLWTRHEEIQGRAHAAYHGIMESLWEPGIDEVDRKIFAEAAKRHADLTPLLFQLLDGRDISASIWKTLKPKGQTASLLDRNEDNA